MPDARGRLWTDLDTHSQPCNEEDEVQFLLDEALMRRVACVRGDSLVAYSTLPFVTYLVLVQGQGNTVSQLDNGP